MKIANLVSKAKKTTWVEFEAGISFELQFVSRPQMKVLTDQSTSMAYDSRSKVSQPKIDSRKLASAFTKEAVKGWKGVTPSSIAQIAPVDLANVSPEDLNKEIPFSHDDLAELVEQSSALETFLYEHATDVRVFNPNTAPAAEVAKN